MSLERLPESSNSLKRALLNAFGSTEESAPFDLSPRVPLSTVPGLSLRRFSVAGGGVEVRYGVTTEGVILLGFACVSGIMYVLSSSLEAMVSERKSREV